MGGDGPIRVAILGGGAGAMAAAFALSATAELRRKYRLTVYQQGWRLGGKGASGRNAAYGQRIEEHGLHIWLGFYENAFRLMRDCYAEWQAPAGSPVQSFDDAFRPLDTLTVIDRLADEQDGPWDFWNVEFPRHPGSPGVDPSPYAISHWLERLVAWLGDRLAELIDHHRAAGAGRHPWLEGLEGASHPAFAALDRLIREAGSDLVAAAESRGRLLEHVESVAAWLLGEVKRAVDDVPIVRRLLHLLELGIAALRGITVDVLPYGMNGFTRIDDRDLKDWLAAHGASDDAVWSAPMRGFYDLAFAYVGGVCNREKAQGAAGAGLKMVLRMVFGYRGSLLYKMQAGIGDIVFAPLYAVLRERGVEFEFFHRVQRLRLSPDGARVDRVDLWRQARLRANSYDPLIDVGGLPCWPSEPRWEQLEGGDELGARAVNFESAWCAEHVEPIGLARGTDFDLIVLAMPPASLRTIAAELCVQRPEFRAMVENSASVVTQAVQLWMTRPVAELGWEKGAGPLTGFARAFCTWCDMSHLLPRESWPPPAAPEGIQYFCGTIEEPDRPAPLDDSAHPARQLERVRVHAAQWLDRRTRFLWPKAVDGGGALDWNLLFDREGRSGIERLAAQYFRVNIDPSERYVLSLPGTIRYRLDPGRSGFENVYLAGDWTLTSVNGGCVEAAVESGLRAARAISGSPARIAGDEE